jgi:hypothetical protein
LSLSFTSAATAGLENVVGYLDGGIAVWEQARLEDGLADSAGLSLFDVHSRLVTLHGLSSVWLSPFGWAGNCYAALSH